MIVTLYIMEFSLTRRFRTLNYIFWKFQAAIYNRCSATITVDLEHLEARTRNYRRTVLVFIFYS